MEIAASWDDAKIEYIFSVPTTWKPHPTVERFRAITEKAGFGKSPNHKSYIGLTEAEAAAVYMAKEAPGIFKENDILLVCDAGGGTTVGLFTQIITITRTCIGPFSITCHRHNLRNVEPKTARRCFW